jgi:hypothetical protein
VSLNDSGKAYLLSQTADHVASSLLRHNSFSLLRVDRCYCSMF